jgi:hypothetical protein
MTTCQKCNGTGGLPIASGFSNENEESVVVTTCDECDGRGYLLPRFFVEFTFTDNHSGSTFWLPLYILSDDLNEATRKVQAVKIGLEERYVKVNNRKPIPEAEFSKKHIQNRFLIHRGRKLAILNVRDWKFQETEIMPEWGFEKNVEFVSEKLPLQKKDIAKLIGRYEFPVRIVWDFGSSMDTNEVLLINIVS